MWREQALTRLTGEAFDVLVIGGGATGAGIALDAAGRGLRVALLERADFSEGTSSRSTKLLHGGVRYLELAVKRLDGAQFRLVKDALHERHTLLRLAPHLASTVALITPLYSWFELPYYYIGLKAYDLLAGAGYRIGASRLFGRQETLRRLPGLRPDGLRGSVMYFDGRFDDSRMNLALVRTAAAQGATVLNHAEVTQLLVESGRVFGARFNDKVGGASHEVRARVVVNATGPFVDHVRKLDDPNAADTLTASSGTHIVLAGEHLPGGSGMLIPKTDDGRVLFLLPWQGHTLVGTTDNPAVAEAAPKAPEGDVDYLLDYLGRYMQRTFTRADVLSAWVGFRPLVKPQKSVSTAQITRDHHIEVSAQGLVTVTGGKWTTYRLMASDALDRAVTTAGLTAGPSRTANTPLVGAEGFGPQLAGELAAEFGLDADVAEHLAHAYGGEARSVAALGLQHGLLTRLHPAHPYVEAEVVWAKEQEYAVSADDVLERRLRLGFLDREAAMDVAERTEALLARTL